MHLIILRYHSTDWYAGMEIHMVEDCLKHFTTNIIKVQIDTIREIPALFMNFIHSAMSIDVYSKNLHIWPCMDKL